LIWPGFAGSGPDLAQFGFGLEKFGFPSGACRRCQSSLMAFDPSGGAIEADLKYFDYEGRAIE
jgi:hypothetical protein